MFSFDWLCLDVFVVVGLNVCCFSWWFLFVVLLSFDFGVCWIWFSYLLMFGFRFGWWFLVVCFSFYVCVFCCDLGTLFACLYGVCGLWGSGLAFLLGLIFYMVLRG